MPPIALAGVMLAGVTVPFPKPPLSGYFAFQHLTRRRRPRARIIPPTGVNHMPLPKNTLPTPTPQTYIFLWTFTPAKYIAQAQINVFWGGMG